MEEFSDTGRRLRQVRQARGKSLTVIARLAGISTGHLSRLEHGERALDQHSLTAALANALEIGSTELTALPIPAPGNGHADSAIDAIRRALMAVSFGISVGQVHPVDALRVRVATTVEAHYRCGQDDEVGAALPALICDLHASIAAGRDVAELLDLAVLLHTHATIDWLRSAGAPVDLRSQVAILAQQAAQHRDTPTALGLAGWGGLHTLLVAGAFDLAQAVLDAVTVPTNNPDSAQLAGMLMLSHSLVAAADSRPADVPAPLKQASELAKRTGEGNAYWMGFGPTTVEQWRLYVALELGDYGQAAGIAEGIQPEEHAIRLNQARYWVDYARALARLRGRRDEAVLALRRAEQISPHQVHRNQYARDILAELLCRARQESGGPELQGMAYRAGLSE